MMDRFAVLVGSEQGRAVCHLLHRSGWRPRIVLAAPGLEPNRPDQDGLPTVRLDSSSPAAISSALEAAGVLGVLALGLEEWPDTALAGRLPLGVARLEPAALPDLLGPSAAAWALLDGRSGIESVLVHTAAGETRVVAQWCCALEPRETIGSIEPKLADACARLWLRHWEQVVCGSAPGQALSLPRLAPRRRPEDGVIHWQRHSAATLDRWVRAHARGNGGAYFWLEGERVVVGGAEPAPPNGHVAEATLASASDDSALLAFPDGSVRLMELSLFDHPGEWPAAVTERLRRHRGEPLSSLHRGRRVMTVAAHPDDEVLGAGGALIRHFKRGDEVLALIVCSADPIRYPDGSVDQGADTRRAAHYLGATARGLGFPDQRLDRGSNLELIQALEREIGAFRPSVIYTHYWGDVNADHVRIAEAVDVAARPYSAPWVEAIYAFETPSSTEWTASARGRAFAPTVFVDISGELERKLEAMSCYGSELKPYPHPRSLGALRERAGYWGSVANLPAAEALMLTRSRQ